MKEEQLYYIIGLGSKEDWEAARGSIYYIEDRHSEKALPIFSSAKRVEKYIRANFDIPKAHMEMLESLPESHVTPLTKGRFIIMPLNAEGVARVAATVEADYVVRDPRPGNK